MNRSSNLASESRAEQAAHPVPGRHSDVGAHVITQVGNTCWRIERADHVAVLVDAEEYFRTLHSVLKKARHSILVLGWDFDPRTNLTPDGDTDETRTELATLLRSLVSSRPQLRAHILIWDMVLPLSILRLGYPQRSRTWFQDPIEFKLDDVHPSGACHHQKVVVIDDALAFCGGTDLATDRWDTTEHRDADPRRQLPSGRPHPPRHDLMMMVDGQAARALGELARLRWQQATGEALAPPPSLPVRDSWPEHSPPAFTDVDIAVARTQPAWGSVPAVTENLKLHLASIVSARQLIYLENQYLVAPEIERALIARLNEPDGPEVIVICGSQSPSYFDRLAIDGAQHAMLDSLRKADRFDRFRALTPVTAGGESIIVHSKVSIVDDRLLRIGSTNLNNRSLGFDTECDLALDAEVQRAPSQLVRQSIVRVRNGLLAHHLGVSADEVSAAVSSHRSFVSAIDSLRSSRLCAIQPVPRVFDESPVQALIAEYHLGDPQGVDDAWRPWRRS